MLNEEESQFVKYWEENRLKRKRGFKRLLLGLPLATILTVAILFNFLSGWYRRAEMDLKSNGSLIIVVFIAAILIVIFTTVFSAYHKWDINEQRYRELLAKRNIP